MFNNKIGPSILHETIRFGMFYVDFTNHTKKGQVVGDKINKRKINQINNLKTLEATY